MEARTADNGSRPPPQVLGFAEETPGLCDLGKVTQWSQNNKPTIAQWGQGFSLRETLQ